MSLARLALRLAAVEALCPWSAAQGGPFPTPAGSRVYDSRQQPIDGLSELETKPILIVYTEDDASTPYEGARRNSDEQIVVLVVEVMIAARGVVEIDGPDGPSTIGTLVSPISDPQQEMLLDLVEAAVRRLLDARNQMPSSVALAKVAMEIRRIESQPQRADDKATRLAARTLKLHIKVKPDAWPTAPVSPAPTGLAALPEPLRSVAAVLDPASDGGQSCAAIAVLLPGAPPAPTPLTGIDVTTDVDRDPDNAFPTQTRSSYDPQP